MVVVAVHMPCVANSLFEFIANLTGLNSNPFGSSDPWVAARPSETLAGGPGGRILQWYQSSGVASFPAGFKCELQETVSAIAGCTCYERGCWFAHAAVEFVVSLHIHVGVSRRLREPTCGVAFTGAGLWSAEPVEVGDFARAKQMLVCCVAPLVEHCYTCLWLLSALCWLVVNSGELLLEFFFVGSG
ncbi:hypothetical protein Taro_052712 [Colocasia esculenta]|uniref:Uncharacterized protein n=1 Tax=Colocasia esculenta TaxID=4460 RepID=A0A843XKG1_COLES|nr:hypothetical protein [Colocasia esculenta]